MTDGDLYAPLSVRPRSRSYKSLPVVALQWPLETSQWLHESGEIGPMYDVVTLLPFLPSTLFIMEGSADFLSILDKNWSMTDPEHWQFRITENERAIHTPGTQRAAARVTVTTHYFGFKGGNYFKIIDPVVMYGKSLDDIWQEDAPAQIKLLHWGIALRDFCDDNQMEVRPTIGSLAGQFWTDRRFYPNPRRKVPHKINDRARENLPGNHYQLFTMPTPEREFTAHYLDQTRAHHYHARTTPLPHADALYAYGDFLNLKDTYWQEVPPGFYGLLYLELTLPTLNRQVSWIKTERKFIFTNELPHLLDLGYKVNGVIAAWGSFTRDDGVARYAHHAETQLDKYEDAPWLKPLLLAAYGTLATRASYGETIFRLAKKGEQVQVFTGRYKLTGTLTKRPMKLEPGIVNVIHRGMIEAATRSDSIGFAQHLQWWHGYNVLSIYADAVIVEADDDRPLPDTFPEPWRLKKTLNRLQFINLQSFVSDEMTKLPGVGRDFLRYKPRSPGYAPRKIQYEAPSGMPATTKTALGKRVVKTKGRI